MTSPTRHLTGITTTGTPHLGNYVGAIRPAIAASKGSQGHSFFFLADLHALVKCGDPDRLSRSTLEIAASWLACGLDPERVVFYRQSDVPQLSELAWMLTCVTAKGALNRAHAYKAAVDANVEQGEDPDAGITAGLYGYPVLMAADILAFSATHVPVGRDQVQHIEMARDIAQRFNHLYGQDLLTLPTAVADDASALLPGLDGRKMSKSYDNAIPLFASARDLRAAIARIVTDSTPPGAAKDPDATALTPIHRAFASAAEHEAYRAALQDGMAWGDAKAQVADRIEREIGPLRERYNALLEDPERIESTLAAGAASARAESAPLLAKLRAAVGLRSLTKATQSADASARAADGSARAPVRIKQFREDDGRFNFRIVGGDGKTLAIGLGFDDPRACGAVLGRLRSGAEGLADVDRDSILLNGKTIASLAGDADHAEVSAALADLRNSE